MAAQADRTGRHVRQGVAADLLDVLVLGRVVILVVRVVGRGRAARAGGLPGVAVIVLVSAVIHGGPHPGRSLAVRLDLRDHLDEGLDRRDVLGRVLEPGGLRLVMDRRFLVGGLDLRRGFRHRRVGRLGLAFDREILGGFDDIRGG